MFPLVFLATLAWLLTWCSSCLTFLPLQTWPCSFSQGRTCWWQGTVGVAKPPCWGSSQACGSLQQVWGMHATPLNCLPPVFAIFPCVSVCLCVCFSVSLHLCESVGQFRSVWLSPPNNNNNYDNNGNLYSVLTKISTTRFTIAIASLTCYSLCVCLSFSLHFCESIGQFQSVCLYLCVDTCQSYSLLSHWVYFLSLFFTVGCLCKPVCQCHTSVCQLQLCMLFIWQQHSEGHSGRG